MKCVALNRCKSHSRHRKLRALAEVDKELQEVVHKYVFDFKRVLVTCNVMVPILASIGPVEKDGLLRLVEELKM